MFIPIFRLTSNKRLEIEEAMSSEEKNSGRDLLEENQRLKKHLTECLHRVLEEEKVGRVFHDFNNI